MSDAAPRPTAAPGGSVARNAFHLVLGQVATTALAIVFSATLGRKLGAADFGLYFLVTTTVTFAYVVVEWGQVQFVVREVARQPDRAGVLLGTAMAWRVAGSVPLTLLAILVAWLLGYDGRTLGLLALLMLATLPFFLSQAYGMVFRARERMDLDAQVQVVFKALTLPFALGALFLGWGVGGVIAAQGAAGLVALGLAVLRSRGLHLPPLHLTRLAWRELLVGGMPILAIGLAVTVQPYIDVLVLTKLVPAAPGGLVRGGPEHPGDAGRAGDHPGHRLLPQAVASGPPTRLSSGWSCGRRCDPCWGSAPWPGSAPTSSPAWRWRSSTASGASGPPPTSCGSPRPPST